jgi:hypothetical protein
MAGVLGKRARGGEDHTEPATTLLTMCDEVLLVILRFLGRADVCSLPACSHAWQRQMQVVVPDVVGGWLEWFDRKQMDLCPAFMKVLMRRLKLTGSLVYTRRWGALPALTHLTWEAAKPTFFRNVRGMNPLTYGLTHVSLVYGFNQKVPLPLPPTLTHLHLGNSFTRKLPLPLAPRLARLRLGHSFNRPLPPSLPPCLTHLRLGHHFNHPLPVALPVTLTHLRLGNSFNHPLPAPLPAGLTHLRLGNSFNHPLPAPLPAGLTHLRLGNSFNQALLLLPSTLRSLWLCDCFRHLLSTASLAVGTQLQANLHWSTVADLGRDAPQLVQHPVLLFVVPRRPPSPSEQAPGETKLAYS